MFFQWAIKSFNGLNFDNELISHKFFTKNNKLLTSYIMNFRCFRF